MKIFSLSVLLILSILTTMPTLAAVFVAPFVTQTYGSITQTGGTAAGPYATLAGYGYGGKLGFKGKRFQIGAEYYTGQEGITLKDTTFTSDYDIERTEYGLFVGVFFPKIYNVVLTYLLSSEIKEIGDGDEWGTWSGTAFKVELQLAFFSHLNLSLGYQIGTYDKWESQNGSETENALKDGVSWGTSSYLISISFPFSFEIKSVK